jgi:hypothetical protein
MPERRGRTGPMSTPGLALRARSLARRAGSGAGQGRRDADVELIFRIHFLSGGCTRKYTHGLRKLTAVTACLKLRDCALLMQRHSL